MGAIKLGVDAFFDEGQDQRMLAGKKVGLITNHTAINRDLVLTLNLFQKSDKNYQLTALFAPEHGLFGDHYASESISDSAVNGIPVFSLHGKTRRPTLEMLKKVDILVYDIQDIGSRTYTYISTLLYCLEEAGKQKIPFIVLDRPNPMGGYLVDGPIVEDKWRSFVGCAALPYCHGMTVGELAQFFNEENGLGVDLTVIPMKGWRREMTFKETGLPWVPTSPNIPDADTPFFFPTTALIGELSMVSIGVGYTLPFKLIGAPWIKADLFAKMLNEQKLAGVTFYPFRFRPFFGSFKNKPCEGVLICITDHKNFLPLSTQYTIMGVLKAAYPSKFQEAINNLISSKSKMELFNKLNGSEEVVQYLIHEKYFVWKIRERIHKDREKFLEKRKKYLNPRYL